MTDLDAGRADWQQRWQQAVAKRALGLRDSHRAPHRRVALSELRSRREEVLALAERYKLCNLRIVGSVARGESTSASDLDMITDLMPGGSLPGVADFGDEIEELLGIAVDVMTARSIPRRTRDHLLADAVPL